jgi:DNA invertase Pin-like site-specific DNA recombinase
MKIGYARVSTLDQNPDLQIQKLKEFGCERVIMEHASSSQQNRPALARLLNEIIRPGDALVVWKLDRLARSLRQLIETAAELEKHQIGLVSLTDNIDTTTPGGRLVFHVIGAISEFEAALIRERTRAGLVQARLQGKVGGRPPLISEKDLIAAKSLLETTNLTANEVARRFRIGRSTLFRQLSILKKRYDHQSVP